MRLKDVESLNTQNIAAVQDLASIIATNQPIEVAKKETDKNQLVVWEPTPSKDLSQLFNHYLMLSKIRLTSECLTNAVHSMRDNLIDSLFFHSSGRCDIDDWIRNGSR